MCLVKNRLSVNLQFGAFSHLVFHTLVFLTLIQTSRGQSEIISPSQPITAITGDDVILPCYLDSVMDVFDMTVEWARPDLQPRFVLVWRDGVELESKHPSYKGRTSLFTDELKQGNISLKLSQVKLSDKGTYRCFVPGLARDATVQLVVGAVSSPAVTIAHKNTSINAVVLQCESKGWYPEPELLWLDSEGNLLSAGPTETVRGPDDLYTVSSTVTVEKRHSNNITCRVQQRNINQTREAQIHVPDYFFQDESKSNASSGSPVPIIIGLIVVVVFILAAVLLVWKLRKNKLETKKKSPEDGPEHREEQKLNSKCVHNTELHVVIEGEEESVPLMTGGEEENNVDSREKNNTCQSECKDSQTETHQDQFVTEPELLRDTDRTETESKHTSVNTEKETLISTGQGEGEKMKIEDSGDKCLLSQMFVSKEETDLDERERKKKNNYHTDQKLKKPKKVTTKKKSEQDQKKQENQTEDKQPEKEREKVMKDKKLQSETQERTEREKDETELKAQKDKEQEESTTGLDDKREKDLKMKTEEDQSETENNVPSVNRDDTERTEVNMQQEGKGEENQPEEEAQRKKVRQQPGGFGKVEFLEGEQTNKSTDTEETQRKIKEVEKQERQLLLSQKETTEREKDETELEAQKEHFVKDKRQEESMTGPDDKREEGCEENQRNFTVMTQRKTENNEKLKQTEEEMKLHLDMRGMEEQKHNTEPENSNQHVLENKRQEERKSEVNKDKREKDLKKKTEEDQSETENNVPSVNRDDTERTEVNMQQEGKGEENQPEEEAQRKKVTQQLDTEETQKKVKEVEKPQLIQEQQTEQEPERKHLGEQEETTEKPRKILKARRFKSQKEQQGEMMAPVRRKKREMERDVGKQQQQQLSKKKKHEDEDDDDDVQIREYDKDSQEDLEQQDEDMMEVESEAHIETDVIAEPLSSSRRKSQDQSLMCQEGQEEMDTQ